MKIQNQYRNKKKQSLSTDRKMVEEEKNTNNK